jgi:endoglucanase
LNYRIFEDNAEPYLYKQSGWNFLDQNIRWAKDFDLYLILSMMVPPGGYQPSGGEGGRQWDEPKKYGL